MLGRKGSSSMVKVRWTDKAPHHINDVTDAEEMGDVGRRRARHLRLRRLMEQYHYYEANDYMIDND